jgi:hypothetical protein
VGTGRRGPSRLGASALLLVFLCAEPALTHPRGEPTDLEKLAASIVPDYAGVLRALGPTKPKSITRARDAAIEGYAKADGAAADARPLAGAVRSTRPLITLAEPQQ